MPATKKRMNGDLGVFVVDEVSTFLTEVHTLTAGRRTSLWQANESTPQRLLENRCGNNAATFVFNDPIRFMEVAIRKANGDVRIIMGHGKVAG